MRLDFIENNGPDNLRDTLKAQLARASHVCIAVAFVTQSGLADILQPLRQVAATGSVRLLTGLYQQVTEPQALKTLLGVQRETRGRFSVRLSREPHFHRKLYLISNQARCIMILGSSNLTREGLRSGGELNLFVPLLKDSSPLKRVMQCFEDDWEEDRSASLTSDQIEEYEKTRPVQLKWESYTKGKLAKILGVAPTHRQATSEDDQVTDHWRDCITGPVKPRTEQIISETTNWDDKNYWWFSSGGPSPYKIGDRIFFFDFDDHSVYLVKVKDKARMKVATPDGRHFVAYSRLRLKRRFSKKLWGALKGEGIYRKNARDQRKVSPEKAERLKRLLRSTKKRKS
jgi:HKD family nuclease